MATSSSSSCCYSSNDELNRRCEIRSLSLPSKSDAINKRIEKELQRLRTKEESSNSAAQTLCIGLSGLADLYSCINQVLSLPLTQQALSLRQHDKCIRELLQECSNLTNVYNSARDLLVKQTKLIKDLLLALSDQNQGLCYFESKIAAYICSRKELINSAKGLVPSLKQLIRDDSFEGASRRVLVNQDHQLSAITNALKCVSIINISVCESLLMFISIPTSKPKSSGSSLVSKLIHKAKMIKSSGNNEFKDAEASLFALSSSAAKTKYSDKMQDAQNKFQSLEGVLDIIWNCLDASFMQLTQTKACLINIVSF